MNYQKTYVQVVLDREREREKDRDESKQKLSHLYRENEAFQKLMQPFSILSSLKQRPL